MQFVGMVLQGGQHVVAHLDQDGAGVVVVGRAHVVEVEAEARADPKRYSRASLFGVVAGREAWADAGLRAGEPGAGVLIGSGGGGHDNLTGDVMRARVRFIPPVAGLDRGLRVLEEVHEDLFQAIRIHVDRRQAVSSG